MNQELRNKNRKTQAERSVGQGNTEMYRAAPGKPDTICK